MITSKWRHQPPPIPKAYCTPSPWLVKVWEIEATFWNVLCFEHDGMEKQAAAAREECRQCADWLRRNLDERPGYGPEASDALIAWYVHYARQKFARDLANDTDWRQRRGIQRLYV